MIVAALVASGFLCGSLMFSDWLPRLRGASVRASGDGNPGAVNAFKAAGPGIGVMALVLDFLKGALPVAAAKWWLGIGGWALVPIVLAPVLGHVFSPFLGFRGGKGIAATFGVWSGVTLWEMPCVLGAGLLLGRFVFRIRRDALVTMLGMAGVTFFAVLRLREPALVAAALLNWALLAYTHRRELARK
jgi:acyl phosphate:glycerol-3-phosphate acyltransferase